MSMFGAPSLGGATVGVSAQPLDIMQGDQPGLPPLPQLKPHQGMFGQGGVGRNIIGMIGDFLMARAGMQPMFAPMMMLRQQQQQAEAEHQQHIQDDRDKFVFENQWKLDHPAPVNNDTVADYDFISQQLGPEAAKQFLQTKTNPVVMTPYGPMPYSQVMGSRPQVGAVIDDPRKGGAGAAVPPPTFR